MQQTNKQTLMAISNGGHIVRIRASNKARCHIQLCPASFECLSTRLCSCHTNLSETDLWHTQSQKHLKIMTIFMILLAQLLKNLKNVLELYTG